MRIKEMERGKNGEEGLGEKERNEERGRRERERGGEGE